MRAATVAAAARAEAVWNAAQVHEVGGVPATPATPYLVVSATGGADENYQVDGKGGSTSHGVVVQCFGKSASEVGFALDKADAAFKGHRLTIAGFDTTAATAQLEANIYRDPDAGSLLMVTQTYAFHIYPA